MKRRSFFKTAAIGGAAFTLSPLAACDEKNKQATSSTADYTQFDLNEVTIAQLQQKMKSGELTAEQLTNKYLERIKAVDQNGPTLRTVIELNPDAVNIARKMDDCGTSTNVNRGSEVWLTLKGIAATQPALNTMFINNNVIVYVMTSPLQYAQAIGASPQDVWNAQKGEAAQTLLLSNGDGQNAIIVYENVANKSAGYPSLTPTTSVLRGHDAIHEMGHHFDRYSGNLHLSIIFGNLYPDDQLHESSTNPNHAADSLQYAYWWNDKAELFAEEFAIAFNSVHRPVDVPTHDYFQCTLRYVNSWARNQANPSAGSYPGSWCTP